MQPRYRRQRRSSSLDGILAIVFIVTLAGVAVLGARPLLQLAGALAADGSSPRIADGSSSIVTSPAGDPSLDLAATSSVPDPSGVATIDPATDPVDPSPTPTPRPRKTPKPTPALHPPPSKGPFSMDLYRAGFVSEFAPTWCVPAAMMTMINILDPKHRDSSRRTQKRLYDLGQRLSSKKLDGDGVEPEGWAQALNHEGYGPYALRIFATRRAAIHAAAKALRMTGKPVGLVTWRGAHSWVMSGFKATADPARTDHFEVTDIWIEDVWYPRVSSIWGASDPPDSLVPVDRLYIDFLPFYRPTVKYPGKDGNFLIIEPQVATPEP